MNSRRALPAQILLAAVAMAAIAVCTIGALGHGRQAWRVLADLRGVRETAGHRIHIGPTDLLNDAWYTGDGARPQSPRATLLIVVDGGCPECDRTLEALGPIVEARGTRWILTIATTEPTAAVDGFLKAVRTAGVLATVRVIRDLDAFQSASGITGVPALIAVTPQNEVAAVVVGGASSDVLGAFFHAVDSFRDGGAATVIRGSRPKGLASSVASPATPAVGDGSDLDHPVRVGGSVQAPRRVSGQTPTGGRPQGRRGVDTTSIVELTLDPAGRVARVKILVNPLGDDRALSEALRTWRYEPVTVEGRDVWAILTTSVVLR